MCSFSIRSTAITPRCVRRPLSNLFSTSSRRVAPASAPQLIAAWANMVNAAPFQKQIYVVAMDADAATACQSADLPHFAPTSVADAACDGARASSTPQRPHGGRRSGSNQQQELLPGSYKRVKIQGKDADTRILPPDLPSWKMRCVLAGLSLGWRVLFSESDVLWMPCVQPGLDPSGTLIHQPTLSLRFSPPRSPRALLLLCCLAGLLACLLACCPRCPCCPCLYAHWEISPFALWNRNLRSGTTMSDLLASTDEYDFAPQRHVSCAHVQSTQSQTPHSRYPPTSLRHSPPTSLPQPMTPVYNFGFFFAKPSATSFFKCAQPCLAQCTQTPLPVPIA